MKNKDKYMFCPKCGGEIRKHSLICTHCNSILDRKLEIHKGIQDGSLPISIMSDELEKKQNETTDKPENTESVPEKNDSPPAPENVRKPPKPKYSNKPLEEVDDSIIGGDGQIDMLACRICKSIEGNVPTCHVVVDQYSKNRKCYYRCISKDRTQIVLLYRLLQKL